MRAGALRCHGVGGGPKRPARAGFCARAHRRGGLGRACENGIECRTGWRQCPLEALPRRPSKCEPARAGGSSVYRHALLSIRSQALCAPFNRSPLAHWLPARAQLDRSLNRFRRSMQTSLFLTPAGCKRSTHRPSLRLLAVQELITILNSTVIFRWQPIKALIWQSSIFF